MDPQPAPRPIDSWQSAEENAAAWMRYWGFPDAQLTPPGSDGGIDVRAKRALAQVKYEARDIGREVLQRLVGARGREQDRTLVFFTGAGYSDLAVEYANEMEIALFKYALNGSMNPLNRAARHLYEVGHEIAGQNRMRPWEGGPGDDGDWDAPLRESEAVQRVPGEVFGWFEYRCSAETAKESILADAFDDCIEPSMSNSDLRLVAIAPAWAGEYDGLVWILAHLYPLGPNSRDGVRITWSAILEPSTGYAAELARIDAHFAAKRANDMFAEQFNGWRADKLSEQAIALLGTHNPFEDGEGVHASSHVDWFDYRGSVAEARTALVAVHAQGGGKPPEISEDGRTVIVRPDWVEEYVGLVAIGATLTQLHNDHSDQVRVTWTMRSVIATADMAERAADDAHAAAERANDILIQHLGAWVDSGHRGSRETFRS
jgi:hypothetical protein